jgi:hypothetical protein
MGLIGLVVGLIGAAFRVAAGLMRAAFGLVMGLMGPLTPVLIVLLIVFWLAGGTKEGSGYVRNGDRR